MSANTDAGPTPAVTESVSRRALIKKTLALGSVGYVAPMILGSATPASAQVISTCSFESCLTNCEGGNPDACCCTLTTEGSATVAPVCPSPTVICNSSADCASNQVCMSAAADCCDEGENVCIYVCGEFPSQPGLLSSTSSAQWG